MAARTTASSNWPLFAPALAARKEAQDDTDSVYRSTAADQRNMQRAHGSQATNAIFALSLVAFVAFLVPIWVNAPMAESKDVWGHWEDK
ncbi:hypothetical protein MY11210_006505 [Beauveria gryllotalpidicola]